ncbi:MAG: dockerin type I domain-containing protein [Candidatus Poribacteria bacterium]|nr:dockerin type I domain-containing protein [Candidatus Poribacteria bacterium]
MRNKIRKGKLFNFTEIVCFEILDKSKSDLNADGKVNILDLVRVALAIGETGPDADINGDGVVNILDLVQIANHL